MPKTLKEKLKAFAESPAPELIMLTVALVSVVVVYEKYTTRHANAYADYLDTKAGLFANALSKTTDSIITALHPE